MIKKILDNQYVYFVCVAAGIFLITFSVLYLLGFAPKSFYDASQEIPSDEPKTLNELIQQSLKSDSQNDETSGDEENITNVAQKNPDANKTATTKNTTGLIPDSIKIPKIGVDSIVKVPANVTLAVLDQALTQGAVYYPGSGNVNGGNILIFGHSTNWQVVQNQAYKTFNDFDKLKAGDEVYLFVGSKKYIYKIKSVVLTNENDAKVVFDSSKRTLTLSTCNTFGAKQDRWVVNAEFYKEG